MTYFIHNLSSRHKFLGTSDKATTNFRRWLSLAEQLMQFKSISLDYYEYLWKNSVGKPENFVISWRKIPRRYNPTLLKKKLLIDNAVFWESEACYLYERN